MNTRTALLAGLALSVALAGADVLSAQGAFSDQTVAAGVDHVNPPAADHPHGPHLSPVTVGDFNNDGWPDLFVPSLGVDPARLFINQKNGTFSEEAAAWGVADLYRGMAAAVADVDGDGWQDIYVTSSGDMTGSPNGTQHKLYKNNGNGTFSEVAAMAGVQALSATAADGYGSCFGDYDLDGDLDLITTGWMDGSNASRLFRNNGDGTFTHATDDAGIGPFLTGVKSFGARFVDINGDRYPEIFIVADMGTTKYLINNGDGTFSDGSAGFSEMVQNGMGHTIADFNNDGHADYYATSIYHNTPPAWPNGNRLYLGNSDHTWNHLPESSGVWDTGWAWGCDAIDFDHDGWQDIVATNGWPSDPEWGGEQAYALRNNQDDTFTEVAASIGLIHNLEGRALVLLDYDRDGDMDIAIAALEQDFKLFRNDIVVGPTTGWLEVELNTNNVNVLAPHGIGAKITVTAGGLTQTRWMGVQNTYLGNSEMLAHYGLADATVVDEVRVDWPNGFSTVLENVAINQRLTIAAENPLVVDPLVRGQTSNLTVSGANQNEMVAFMYSTEGIGEGPAVGFFGGMRLDILPPVLTVGIAQADATGTAVLPVPVPLNAPPVTVFIQAVVVRGLNGSESAKSNVVTATVQ